MKTNEKKQLLTEGPIGKSMIAFAIPIFLGNLFQQFYNISDSFIVGNFLGSDALAAVSSSGSLIFLLIGFLSGIAIGAGVVIAQFYGAKEYKNVSKAIHTEIAFGLVAGILLTIIGLILTPQILRWMGTPKSVLPNSILFFRVYFSGSLFVVLFNMFMGILQAVGDSRHPLYYLMISSVMNVVLDLIFVGVFHKGVGFAALGTVISQFFCMLLCLRRLIFTNEVYKVSLNQIHFDLPMLRKIVGIGIPSGLQNSIISFANIIVQSNINKFNVMAVAGCGVYTKIEGFAFLPITCFALSLTTYIGQNLGAREFKRVKAGAKFGMICSLIIAELIGIVIFITMPVLVAAFNHNPQVIAYGTQQARTECLFYFLLAFSHCTAGIMRGAGKSTVPMLVMMVCWCFIRITYITTVIHFIPKIEVVFWAYPLTWGLSTIVFGLYLSKSHWLIKYKEKCKVEVI